MHNLLMRVSADSACIQNVEAKCEYVMHDTGLFLQITADFWRFLPRQGFLRFVSHSEGHTVSTQVLLICKTNVHVECKVKEKSIKLQQHAKYRLQCERQKTRTCTLILMREGRVGCVRGLFWRVPGLAGPPAQSERPSGLFGICPSGKWISPPPSPLSVHLTWISPPRPCALLMGGLFWKKQKIIISNRRGEEKKQKLRCPVHNVRLRNSLCTMSGCAGNWNTTSSISAGVPVHNIVYICRCSSSPRHPMYPKHVDPSVLASSLSLNRLPHICLLFISHFIYCS